MQPQHSSSAAPAQGSERHQMRPALLAGLGSMGRALCVRVKARFMKTFGPDVLRSIKTTALGIGTTYAGRLTTPEQPGTYELVVRLAYKLPDQPYGEVFTRTLTFQEAPNPSPTNTPTLTPSPTATSTPTLLSVAPPPDDDKGSLGLVLISALALAAFGGGTWWRWRTMRALPLSGSLNMNGTPMPLSGRGHNLDLRDSAGAKQGKLKLYRERTTGELRAKVAQLKAGQTVNIDGFEYGKGDEVPLQDGSQITFDGQTTTYHG